MDSNMQGMAELLAARYGAISTATAGGTGDNTEVDGAYIDRTGFQSVKLVIGYKAVLGSNATLSLSAKIQDATSSGGAVADFGSEMAKAIVASGGVSGATVTGVVELDFDISGADDFIRAVYTPDLSAANTDTVTMYCAVVLAGATEQPVTAKSN